MAILEEILIRSVFTFCSHRFTGDISARDKLQSPLMIFTASPFIGKTADESPMHIGQGCEKDKGVSIEVSRVTRTRQMDTADTAAKRTPQANSISS